MYISKVHLKGFRNFQDSVIQFSDKALIIGSNDIGKTNLIFALRLLLDKSLPPSRLEPLESDFYVIEDTNEIRITIQFSNVVEDCLVAKLKHHIV